MSGQYPRLGIHRVPVELPPLPAPDGRWVVTVLVTVRHGALVEWEADEVVHRGEGGTSSYSLRSLESPLPQLVARLCGHAERWFQEERDRVERERKPR
jgi:hypothetical protein